MNEAIEPYIKPDVNIDKVRAAAVDACKRLGRWKIMKRSKILNFYILY